MDDRNIETFALSWHGIEITIRWEANWLNMTTRGYDIAHLQVKTTIPERTPLSITETGYRSHFTSVETVAAYGGPLAFVQRWLDEEAKSAAWKAHEAASRQMTLF